MQETLYSQRPLQDCGGGSMLCKRHLTKLLSNSDKERKSQSCLRVTLGPRWLEPTHIPAKQVPLGGAESAAWLRSWGEALPRPWVQ